MIVHSRGLYLWLAVHDKIIEIDTKAEEAVKYALEEHIYDIVGGDFRSRRASLTDNDVNTAAPYTTSHGRRSIAANLSDRSYRHSSPFFRSTRSSRRLTTRPSIQPCSLSAPIWHPKL